MADNVLLLVEDDAATAALERRLLSRLGFDVVVAGTLSDALFAATRGGLAVVVLDYRLGNESAWPVLDAVRERTGGSVPVIVATGMGDESIAAEAMRRGASAYLVKGDGFSDELPRTVSQVVGDARRRGAVLESERQHRLLLETLADAVIAADARGSVIVFNPAAEELTGRRRSDVLGLHWTALVPSVERRLREALVAGISDADPAASRRRLEFDLLHADGRSIPVAASISTHGPDHDWLFVAVLRDTREQRDALEQLRLRERAMEAVANGIIITDERRPDRPIVYVNRGFERLTGYSKEECVGRNCRFLQGPETDPATVAAIRTALDHRTEFRGRLLNRRKDGSTFWNELVLAPVTDAAGEVTHFVGIQNDVTDRIRAEESLRDAARRVSEAEKMRALGRISSGVAHDFNNALSGVLGFLEMSLRDPSLTAEVRGFLKRAQTSGNDAAQVVRRLQEFAKGGDGSASARRRPLDLRSVAAEVPELTRHRWRDQAQRDGITIGFDADIAETPAVMAEASEIRELLTNLVLNAADALPRGGRITLSTGTVDGRAFVRVSDDGVGMDAETARRCFEPFFTTKGVRGTGMGLAVCWSIAERCGGRLEVRSAPGAGSTFTLTLPAAATAAGATSGVRSAVHPTVATGRLKILLIDDDPRVLEAVAGQIAAMKHAVETAPGGREGLRLLENTPFDVVITDLGMPNMDGRMVAKVAKVIRPEVKVALLTGWAREFEGSTGYPEGVDAVIAKPASATTLRTALAQLVSSVH